MYVTSTIGASGKFDVAVKSPIRKAQVTVVGRWRIQQITNADMQLLKKLITIQKELGGVVDGGGLHGGSHCVHVLTMAVSHMTHGI